MVAELSKPELRDIPLKDIRLKYPAAYRQMNMQQKWNSKEAIYSPLWSGFAASMLLISYLVEYPYNADCFGIDIIRAYKRPSIYQGSLFVIIKPRPALLECNVFLFSDVNPQDALNYLSVFDYTASAIARERKFGIIELNVPDSSRYMPGQVAELGYQYKCRKPYHKTFQKQVIH